MKQIFKTFVLVAIIPIFLVIAESDYGKLPNCKEDSVPGLVLVSTIDGKFTALNERGTLEWQIDTGPGPLLTSNIHNLELTNSGKWIRIIPSLTGFLYRFDGVTIDPISISADSLLRSSFKYSEDLIIAGGIEVRTYGVNFRTGDIFYTCSSLNCINNTNTGEEMEDDNILLLERNTQTVRAIEARSGYERWNFSVGSHNIKLPQISCTNQDANLFNWNLTAIIPDGILLATKKFEDASITWQYQFYSPIVRVWKWDGFKISEVDLFHFKSDSTSTRVQASPSIYLGMHKKQLYIHESAERQKISYGHVAETGSLSKIPWKPIPASGTPTEEDSTAISVLYSSEYVNGRGYYFYSDYDRKKMTVGNRTLKFPALAQHLGADTISHLLFTWWIEILISLISTTVLCTILLRRINRRQSDNKVIFVERRIEIPGPVQSEEPEFYSRYLNDFDTLQCLGKGGFGIVFQVKQKIDECQYAIKRIMLPLEDKKRETVMREVKALAKLEHPNIVRYFNSWVEKPPFEWKEKHDQQWINNCTDFTTDFSTEPDFTKGNVSIDIKTPEDTTEADSFIVFDQTSTDSSTTNSQLGQTSLSVDSETETESVTSLRASQGSPLNTRPAFLYIQMQLCQKHSLRQWLITNAKRETGSVLHIFKQILSAVEYVHLQGLIHRDLKPNNIFFALDGQIKVGDFGLVKDEESHDPSSDSLSAQKGHTKEVGTRLYMSPEQLNGFKYNYKVDIYSLGLIFFELFVHFGTEMERIRTMTDVRDHKFPKEFIGNYPEECALLSLMLCAKPKERLTTFGVRARPPLNHCDSSYGNMYDFELPKTSKNHRTTNLE